MADLRIAFVDNSVMDSLANKLKAYLEGVLPADLLSRLYITSAHRGNSNADYHEDTGVNGALDIAGPMTDQGQQDMRDAAAIIVKDATYLLEEIHTTPYPTDNGFYVKNGQVVGPGFYGPATENQHLNHIHLAASESMASILIGKYPKAVDRTLPPAPQPNMATTLFGHDGSDYTHVGNFAGLSFITWKLCEPAPEQTYIHNSFGPAMRSARDQGIPFLGAYVVPRTGDPTPEGEADVAITELKRQAPWLLDHPGFFWQVDLEKWPYDAVAAGLGVALCDALRAKTGKPVVLYASKGMYGDSIPGSDNLWNANYDQSGASRPFRDMYAGSNGLGWQSYSGRTPLIWQYASDAKFADGNTGDINAFRGNEDDFRRLVLGATGPVPPTTGVVNMSELERSAHNADHYGWTIVDDRDVMDVLMPGDVTVPISNKLKERLVRLETKIDSMKAPELDYDKLARALLKAIATP